MVVRRRRQWSPWLLDGYLLNIALHHTGQIGGGGLLIWTPSSPTTHTTPKELRQMLNFIVVKIVRNFTIGNVINHPFYSPHPVSKKYQNRNRILTSHSLERYSVVELAAKRKKFSTNNFSETRTGKPSRQFLFAAQDEGAGWHRCWSLWRSNATGQRECLGNWYLEKFGNISMNDNLTMTPWTYDMTRWRYR